LIKLSYKLHAEMASKIFTGYRALGFVSNHVPLAVRYHQKHKEHYVVTCVGKSFYTYNVSDACELK